MAKASEQFRQSDVALWGLVALACAGLAVFGSNAALLVPQGILSSLHQPRNAGASIETLRREVRNLRAETTRLGRESELLRSRFALQEKSGGEITRRVGALESSVPLLLEERAADMARVDRDSTTASIGENGAFSFEAEGGSVSVRHSPMPQVLPAQPLPPPLTPPAGTTAPTGTYGAAIGAPVSAEQAPGLWADLSLKLGPLLFGMAPLLAEEADGEGQRIIVGPVAALAEARTLCERFERVSIAYQPAPYDGAPLPQNP